MILWEQVPQRKIIHYILNLLDLVLDGVTPLPKDIVLEVEYLETSMHIFDELANQERNVVVPHCDGVARESSLGDVSRNGTILERGRRRYQFIDQ